MPRVSVSSWITHRYVVLRGVQKTHRPTKPDLTNRVGSIFKAWWVGLGYKIFFIADGVRFGS